MAEYKKIENAKAELTCTLDGETWEKARKTAFNKLAKKVEIKGFRKGQAPRNLVEKYVSNNEVLIDAKIGEESEYINCKTPLIIRKIEEYSVDEIIK